MAALLLVSLDPCGRCNGHRNTQHDDVYKGHRDPVMDNMPEDRLPMQAAPANDPAELERHSDHAGNHKVWHVTLDESRGGGGADGAKANNRGARHTAATAEKPRQEARCRRPPGETGPPPGPFRGAGVPACLRCTTAFHCDLTPRPAKD